MKIWRNISYLAVAAAILLTSFTSLPASATLREDLNEVSSKITELNSQIDSYEKEAKELAKQADSISRQIAVLQNEQAKLKKQIELKQAEHDQIVLEIEAVQKRINDNYELIGYVIAQYYYNDGVSTIELSDEGGLIYNMNFMGMLITVFLLPAQAAEAPAA